MKTLIAPLIAATAAVSSLQAHCGTCSLDAGAESHEACHESTLASYFSIQKALASDDLEAARAAAAGPAETTAKSECSADCGDSCSELSAAAHAIADATDIATARASFLAFSNTLIAQLEAHPGDTIAYQMHCPMAFKGKGGSWLQDSSQLKNPYYGAAMLTCGAQKAIYGPAKAADASDHADHSGHSH